MRDEKWGRHNQIAKLKNRIPLDMRKKDTADAFKNALKKYFLA